MFDKILIANRGEIACRVIKTARKMGIRTVAVYSDADENSRQVAMADEAVHIGPSPPRESYLQIGKVIDAALKTGAQAIHPGYGFLSENAAFCRLCVEHNIAFIGPPAGAIEAMGSKSAAKSIMEHAGVPLVPGYHGEDQNPELIRQTAEAMGYPVLLKAVAGGGGRGMRQVWSAEEFDEALAAARREALSSFGNDDMLVEKYLTQPRHIEFQVFCDRHGGALYLFERDCSVQRRHQKVIEEAPAPGMTEDLRRQMGRAAVCAAQAIDYQGAGTVEFLLDVDGSFYFMEMNTRLQVEHPVTEMITGQDLVEWQLRVAAGEALPLTQQQLGIRGHAFEARVYAEDPDNDFLPDTGTLKYLQAPAESAHVRVDTGVVQGDDISVYYDPMIAKLIVWDENRARALERLALALSEYRIDGLATNIKFLYNLATCAPFVEAELDTGFIEKHRGLIFHERARDIEADLPLASLYLLLRREQIIGALTGNRDVTSPWNAVNGWRMNQPSIHTGAIILNGTSHDVPVAETGSGTNRRFRIGVGDKSMLASGSLDGNEFYANIDGHRQRAVVVSCGGEKYRMFPTSGQPESGAMDFQLAVPDYGDDEGLEDAGGLMAPMNGTLVDVRVEAGARVGKGQTLVIVEAMKMEHSIRAPADGVVTDIYYSAGDLVDADTELLAFAAD